MARVRRKDEALNRPKRQRRSARVLVLLIGGVISGALFTIALAALFFVRWRGIERTNPIIVVEEKGKVVSSNGVVIPISLRDDGSGIERVVVWVQQGGKAQEVFRTTLQQQAQFSHQVEFSPTGLGLTQGEVTMVIEVVDASIWRNRATRVLSLSVDNDPPVIDVLARSESVRIGEFGLAAYRVTDASLKTSGVTLKFPKTGEITFDGLVSKDVDAAFAAPNLFLSFFVAPEECPSSVYIFATDEGGNVSRQNLAIECSAAQNSVARQLPVTPKEILERAGQLAEKGGSWSEALRAELERVRGSVAPQESSPKSDRLAAMAVARFLLTGARAADWEQVAAAVRRASFVGRWWRSAARVGVFAEKAGYHDVVALSDDQGTLASFKPQSLEMTPVQPGFSVVFSPYRGTVRLSGTLGVLGEVVVIDHGAGLSSVFYSLDGRYVETGALVEEGQQIGRIGDSGFHFSKALRMQFLLAGVPIDPGALFDFQRFYQNIELPLNGVRSKIGVNSPTVKRPGIG